MRTLRLSLTGTVILVLLGGLGGVVVAQDEAEEPTAVTVTVTQECAGGSPCTWTASDPRLPATLDTEMFTGLVEVEGAGFLDAGFAWLDVGFEGPEGGWTGYVYGWVGVGPCVHTRRTGHRQPIDPGVRRPFRSGRGTGVTLDHPVIRTCDGM